MIQPFPNTGSLASTRDGKKTWTFVADGRIDSPPTISGGLCLFGTRSGFVYGLRAADGELAWRFRAGSRWRQLFSYEQLESVWPVHGSVLVDDRSASESPLVYFAAGRSSHLDGGIQLYALELESGKVVHRASVTMDAGAVGVKIAVAGRLSGAELARREQTLRGSIPLHTFTAKVDYGAAEARTKYGAIGVKVWINTGLLPPGQKKTQEPQDAPDA